VDVSQQDSNSESFQRLAAEWRQVFGGALPFPMLPSDETEALRLIRQALDERSTQCIDELIPPGAVS